MILTGKQIDFYRLATLKSALRLEILGMKRRGKSVYSIIKSEFGLKGDKESVYKQVCELVESEAKKQTA